MYVYLILLSIVFKTANNNGSFTFYIMSILSQLLKIKSVTHQITKECPRVTSTLVRFKPAAPRHPQSPRIGYCGTMFISLCDH